ncbi:MAG TPA: GAF domain-containing protein [Polyangiaceae bacterium]|nr:GAF domain-containing protein [Polyangiaceae bacterium]
MPSIVQTQPLVLPRFTPGPGAVAMAPPPLVPAGPAPLSVERAPNFTPPPGNVTVVIPPRPRTGTRVSGDELIATLFEAMHDLHFLHDAIQGADFCLQLALGVIPSRAGYAHFFDVEKREFLLVRAKGEDTEELVGKRHLEAEPLLSAAVRAKKAILKDANEALTSRYMTLGGATSVVLAPVLVTGRPLAILELVNPSDGAPFTQDEANALNYIAEQFAEFLSSRGLVFDHGRPRAAHG